MSQHYYQPQSAQPQPGTGQSAGAYPGQGQAQGMGQPYPFAYPAFYPHQQTSASLFSMPNDRFLKGLLIGAAVTYLVTNEQVQRTAIKSIVKTWSLLQGGVEEVKERFGDAVAEMHYSEQQNKKD